MFINFDNNLFGEENLELLIKVNKHLSSKDMALMIIEKVIKFSKENKFSDDRTIVVIKRKN